MQATKIALTVASVLIATASLALVVVAAVWGGTVLQVASSVLAALALVVSALALKESAKSADAASRSAAIAEDQEQRRKYGWSVELLPESSVYKLRNTGSLSAKSVRLAGDFFRIGFLHESGEELDQVAIEAGEARVFEAARSHDQVGLEVEIIWRPEGEGVRRWREVVPPRSRSVEDELVRQREERVCAEEHRRQDTRDVQENILRLGKAYSRWKADPADPGKKLRVQLAVAALPPELAREIGHQVDVPRDVWGPDEYPLTRLVPDEDRHLVEGELAEIELMWNMRQVTDYEVYGPTDAPGPNTEPRIWWAVKGYAERQRERLSGERKLRRSPADQRAHDEAIRQMKEMSERFPIERHDADSPE